MHKSRCEKHSPKPTSRPYLQKTSSLTPGSLKPFMKSFSDQTMSLTVSQVSFTLFSDIPQALDKNRMIAGSEMSGALSGECDGCCASRTSLRRWEEKKTKAKILLRVTWIDLNPLWKLYTCAIIFPWQTLADSVWFRLLNLD